MSAISSAGGTSLVGESHPTHEAESRLTEALRSTVKLRQRQFLIGRKSLLSELWAELAPLMEDLGCSQGTQQEYRHAVGHWSSVFEWHCGGEPSLGYCEQDPRALEFFQDNLAKLASKFHGIRADAGETLSTYTQRRTCRRIGSLFKMAGPPERSHWLYQHALGVLDLAPTFSRAVSVAPGLVRALTADELRTLLAYLCPENAAKIKRPSKLPDVPAWRFWRAYTLCAVYEGLRPAELFRLKWSWIKRGRIEAPPSVNLKQKRWISRRLHAVAAAELEAIRTDREFVFRWTGNAKYCERIAGEVLSAPLPADTWQLGKGLYVLRKTHLTQLEMARIGAAQQSAGHSSPQITRDSYLDPQQTDRDIDLMPDFLQGV